MKKIMTAFVGFILALAFFSFFNFTVLPARAQSNQRGFYFVSNSFAGSNATKPSKQFAGNGAGFFDPAAKTVTADGFYDVIDLTTPVPRTILSSGSWTATDFLGYNETGTYGALVSGILKIGVQLTQSNGQTFSTTLTINCNIGAAGLATKPSTSEGVFITIGGDSFSPDPKFAGPGSGVTIFTTGVPLGALQTQASNLNSQVGQLQTVIYGLSALTVLLLITTVFFAARGRRLKVQRATARSE